MAFGLSGWLDSASISNGGAAANIVPDFAELDLIVRHPDLSMLESIWARVENCLKAGALGTGSVTNNGSLVFKRLS